MSKSTTATKSGIGLTGLAFFWAIVTQCLQWAGIINWPWEAIWGPFLFLLVIAFIWLFVGILIFILVVRRR